MDEELEEAMKEMDNDQNGTVEFEEFYGWWHKHGGRALSNFRQKQEVAKMRDLLFAYARVLVQPVKILVGFGQIVGQLEKVLHIELPENIAALVTVFKPLVANIFQSFLPVGCVASLSYFQRWMFKVFVIPAVLIAAAWFWYAGERLLCRATNLQSSERVRSASTRRLRSNLSLVVFVLYPTICNEVFATFNCRHLTPTQVVLMSDYAARSMLLSRYWQWYWGFCFVLVYLSLQLWSYHWRQEKPEWKQLLQRGWKNPGESRSRRQMMLC
jgi:hypothetical protein